MLYVTCHLHVTGLRLHVICHILHVRNALHSVLSSSKYISHVNLPFVRCYMLHVTCDMLQVICYTSHVLCCMSYVINALHSVLSSSRYIHISHVNLLHVTCHMLHVTCYMSHVTRHMSHVSCCMSHLIHYMSMEMPCVHACFYECIYPVSHYNLSHVTCHASHVTCDM